LLDGVLRRQDKEGEVEIVGHASGRHLVLLHGLEQCSLRLWGCPVDLVGQEDVRKNGALMNRKVRCLLPTSSSRTSVPVISDGIRSGVNWTRLKLSSMIPARVEINRVLARPGTPTSRQWPRQNRAMRISSIALS